MNKKTTIAAVALVAGAAAIFATQQNYYYQLAVRFPDLDRKAIRKAYNQFMKNALSGMYKDELHNLSDEQMDEIFLDIVRKQNPSE